MDAANGKRPKGNVQRAEPQLLTPGLVFFAGFAGFPVGFSSRASLHPPAQEGSWMSEHYHDPRDPKALPHGGRKEIFSAQSSTSLCHEQVFPWVAQKG